MEARNLTAQFESDRSRCACNKDDLAFQRAPDRAFFQMHRRTPQQILNCNFTDLAGQTTLFNDFSQSRHSFELGASRLT